MGYGGKIASRSGDVRRFNFTGNGSNTAFDLGFSPATQNQLVITINGVVQHYDAFSVSGSVVTFTGTPASGDAIQVTAVVDAIGVTGIVDGAVANVSSLRVTTTPVLIGNAVGTFTGPLIQAASNANSWIQINAQNLNNGNNASTDMVLARSDGNDTAGFIDVGINSNTYAQAAYSIMTPNSGYMFTNGGDLVLGTQTAHNVLFHTGNTTSASERMRIAANGTIVANATIQRTLTGDATVMRVVGSYNGNTIFEVAQSSSDGVVYIRDAQGNATSLLALPTGSSTIRSRVAFPDKPMASFRHNAVGPASTVMPATSVFTSSPHLDTTTNSGRFTAPVAGRYRATITSYSNYAGTYNWIGFKKNGAFQDITLHWNNGGYTQHTFVCANQIFTLAANDYLEAALHNSNGAGAGTLDYGYVTFEFLG